MIIYCPLMLTLKFLKVRREMRSNAAVQTATTSEQAIGLLRNEVKEFITAVNNLQARSSVYCPEHFDAAFQVLAQKSNVLSHSFRQAGKRPAAKFREACLRLGALCLIQGPVDGSDTHSYQKILQLDLILKNVETFVSSRAWSESEKEFLAYLQLVFVMNATKTARKLKSQNLPAENLNAMTMAQVRLFIMDKDAIKRVDSAELLILGISDINSYINHLVSYLMPNLQVGNLGMFSNSSASVAAEPATVLSYRRPGA